MIELQFTVTVEANSPEDVPYLKHLLKGSLRSWDPNAKIFCPQITDTKWFEEIEIQAQERGELHD